jgi:hypothetical protein
MTPLQSSTQFNNHIDQFKALNDRLLDAIQRCKTADNAEQYSAAVADLQHIDAALKMLASENGRQA